MRLPRPSLVAFAAALVPFVLPASGASAPVSTTFTVVGYEYAFTSTVGSFAGTGTGAVGGKAYWNARVKHDKLGSMPTYVNGGSFAMTVTGPGTKVDAVVGTFSYHGGTIKTLAAGADCTNQKYLVADTLRDVRTVSTGGGTGTFQVTLTHYRHRVLGRCVAYKARVSGTVTLTY